MGVAYRAGKGIGRVCARAAIQLQQALDHFLNLLFFCMTLADHRLLDLQGGIFGHHQIIQHGGADCGPARLSQHQRRSWIDIDEYLLHRDLIWTVLGDDLTEMIHYGLQPQREFAILRLDTSTADVGKLVGCFVDNPKTCNSQAGVNPKDTDFWSPQVPGAGPRAEKYA